MAEENDPVLEEIADYVGSRADVHVPDGIVAAASSRIAAEDETRRTSFARRRFLGAAAAVLLQRHRPEHAQRGRARRRGRDAQCQTAKDPWLENARRSL